MLYYLLILLLSFQFLYLTLFLLGVFYKLISLKKEKTYLIHSKDQPEKNWLLAVPVVKEEKQLKRCLLSLIDIASEKTSIAVALDGKQYQDLTPCIDIIEQLNSVLPCDDRKMYRTDIVDEYLDAKTDETAYRCECEWRKKVPIQAIPTSVTISNGSHRRKGEALNFLLSLCDKKCLWLYFEKIGHYIIVAESMFDLKERYNSSISQNGNPLFRRIFALPFPDYLLCIDVDETIHKNAFNSLRAIAEQNREAYIVQAVKEDRPAAGGIASMAFQANYSSWFYWEASFPSIEKKNWISCSYYGSMAAIKIGSDLVNNGKAELIGGQKVDIAMLFPEGNRLEDYPFFIEKCINKLTLFLPFKIGTGEAPRDIGAFSALWSRWTRTNVTYFLYRTIPQLIVSWRKDIVRATRIVYHGISWFSYANLALLPIVFGTLAITDMKAEYSFTGLLFFLIIIIEFFRRTLPAPNLSVFKRVVRLPIEFAVSPIAMLEVIAGVVEPLFKLPSPPVATPKDGKHRSVPFLVVGWFCVALIINFIGLIINLQRFSVQPLNLGYLLGLTIIILTLLSSVFLLLIDEFHLRFKNISQN